MNFPSNSLSQNPRVIQKIDSRVIAIQLQLELIKYIIKVLLELTLWHSMHSCL